MSPPILAIVAAGAMGAAVGRRLTRAGLTVLTSLEGRSSGTRARAGDAGMVDASLGDIASRANWVLSILPPSEAFAFAQKFRDAHAKEAATRRLAFADCNAVNPETVKRIAAVFAGTPIKFIDAGIIGGPPQEGYDPVFYASSDPKDEDVLDEFATLKEYGLKVSPLKGEGAGIGDASALKMSYAGITKGSIGIFTTMILSANASSPATAQALLHELASSQPFVLQSIARSVPGMLPKAYRWVGEMEEISQFVEGGLGKPIDGNAENTVEGIGNIHLGLARLYERITRSVEGGDSAEDVKVLKKFVEDAKKLKSQ